MIRIRNEITTALLALLVGFSGTVSSEDVIYSRPFDLTVQGRIVDSPDGLFRVFPDEYDLDLNRDGRPDLRFRHSLTPRSRRVDTDALNLLETAEEGIDDALNIVLGMRRIAIEAANEGVNDHDAVNHFQARIENGIDVIERIANLPFGENGILNGSYGLRTTASSASIDPISATIDTQPDSYAIEVTTQAERAFVNASATQTSSLAADETLVINSVGIDLLANMSQAQVIDRINDFAIQTGVFAQRGPNGVTQLLTEKFGTAAFVDVVSNTAASVQSSGFGWERFVDHGINVEASINSNSYTGNGTSVLATGGSERGLSFRVGEDASNPVNSAGGILGTVDVTNGSPIFVVDEQNGDSVSITLPNILPTALGQGFQSNQFTALYELSVRTAAQANDSLRVIDRSINQLKSHQEELLDFIALNAMPYGSGMINGMNGAEFAMTEFGLFPAGIQVGPNRNYEEDSVLLQDSSVFRDLEQSGFVGARMPVEDGWVYGWIGVEVGGDSSIKISDYAWNTVSNEPIVTGVASNRILDLLLAGDANMDGTVGFSDFLILSNNFGQPGRWHHGDFDHDQTVSFSDFLALSENFGGEVQAMSVPEPDAAVLFALAIWLTSVCRCHRHGKTFAASKLRY